MPIADALRGLAGAWPASGRERALPRVREELDGNPVSLRAFAEGVERDRVAGTVRVPWTILAKRLRNGYSPTDDDWAAARLFLNGNPGRGGDPAALADCLPVGKDGAA